MAHVLLPWATEIAQVDAELRARLSTAVVAEVVGLVPEEWLSENRAAYLDYLTVRLHSASSFVEEALRAHAQLV